MTWNAHFILLLIALILTVLALVKPAWPLLPVAVLLIIVDLLIGAWKP